MEETQINEPKIRINIKRNFKDEMGWEISVKGDTIEEVSKLISEAKKEAKEQTKGDKNG